jgi:TP901 family phage tail tape measure protein
VADQLGQAVLTLTVDDRQFNAGLNRAKSAAEGAGQALRNAIGGLGLATSTAGIAAFIGQQVTQLDAASAAVRTLGVDSAQLVPKLRALSVELGNNISVVELTKAAYDVASSGFATAADATAILRASALGAKGGFAEVADVASAVTGVLNAYGKTSAEAGLLVDQFVQTQADGVITVRQYAAEIGNIASIAAASGISIQELNAAIATATLRGVPVAQTFTGLRQAISSIIKPSEQAKELASSLGLDFSLSALQAKGFGGVLADVQAKTGGATDKIAILLGSVEAQAAVQPLLNDKLLKYNELLGRQAKAAGAASDASQTNASTISSGLEQIGAGFSNLATSLDTVLSPLFAGFLKDINSILIKLNQVSALAPDKVQKRERQATDIVAGQISFLQGTGFFGPATVTYGGKTYKGSATGIREAIIQDLLRRDLADINKPSGSRGKSSPPVKPPVLPDKQLLAQQQQQRVEAELALQTVTQRIAAANELAAAEAGVVREAIRQRQEIEAGVQAAKNQVIQIGAQIDALRQQGKDGPELQKLVDEQKVAALDVRLKLIEGATALKDAGKKLRDDIGGAVLELARVRNDPNGLNRFLNPQQVEQRGQATLASLLPDS